jgi:chemotaxis protein MotB
MERKNPFNDKPGKTKSVPSTESEPANASEPMDDREIPTVPSSMWTVAGYILLCALLGFTGYSLFQQKELNDSLRNEIEKREAVIETAEDRVLATGSQVIALQADLQALKMQKEELLKAQRKAQDDAAKAQKSLKDEMLSALQSRDVTISELQGNLTLNILDRILFDSGQTVIKPEGEDVLKQIGGVLDQVPNRQIHVMGHTDNIPIHTSMYPSNWELSAARALAAVRFLVDNGGVDPKRIAAVAHGEFQPVANNATPEGRARNRRITIVVLPEVFKTPEKPIEEEPVKETAAEPTMKPDEITTEMPRVSPEVENAEPQSPVELPDTKPELPDGEDLRNQLEPVPSPDTGEQ